MSKMTLEEMEVHIGIIEEELKRFRPVVDAWNSGKLIFKFVFILGGIVTGAVTAFAAVSTWLSQHLK